jgi:hypothetical protein
MNNRTVALSIEILCIVETPLRIQEDKYMQLYCLKPSGQSAEVHDGNKSYKAALQGVLWAA